MTATIVERIEWARRLVLDRGDAVLRLDVLDRHFGDVARALDEVPDRTDPAWEGLAWELLRLARQWSAAVGEVERMSGPLDAALVVLAAVDPFGPFVGADTAAGAAW